MSGSTSGGIDYGGLITGAGKAVSGLGGAVTSLLANKGTQIAANGYKQAAASYRTAEQGALTDADIQAGATGLSQFQAFRQATGVIGTQVADIGASGLRESGTGLDLMADSQRQTALTIQQLGAQGQIQINGYKQQANAYEAQAQSADAQAQAAEAASKAGGIGGFLGALGSVAQIGGLIAAPFTGGASLAVSAAVGGGLQAGGALFK